MVNVDLLREEIAKSGLKKKYIASRLGLSSYGLSLKLDGTREFTASEIKVLCDVLGITKASQINSIFLS